MAEVPRPSDRRPIWSDWIPFDLEVVISRVPMHIGVFRTRVVGADELIFVGSATGKQGLAEAVRRRARDISHVSPAEADRKYYLCPEEKEVIAQGQKLEVSFAAAATAAEAKLWKAALIGQCKPRGNKQQPRLYR